MCVFGYNIDKTIIIILILDFGNKEGGYKQASDTKVGHEHKKVESHCPRRHCYRFLHF